MGAGDRLQLTNGEGAMVVCELTGARKNQCRVKPGEVKLEPPRPRRLTLGVALLKNAARVEWLLEKTTEMGVHRIVPLLTHRTIREKFRIDRMKAILVSAMLQSQQSWLPELTEPVSFDALFKQSFIPSITHRYIAHCLPNRREEWMAQDLAVQNDVMILIGPEGDFTPEEIETAIGHGCRPVALGPNRLRTETAAMAAVAGYYLKNA